MPREIFFDEKAFIISKTCTKGKITYGNELFFEMSGYAPSEIMGAPHNILRHGDMPSSVFKLLWDTIKRKEEIFAAVVNKTKQDDFYWVMAHVTPSFDDHGEIIGYHSVRRKPSTKMLDIIKPIYKTVLEAERMGGTNAGEKKLMEILQSTGKSYEEFILSI